MSGHLQQDKKPKPSKAHVPDSFKDYVNPFNGETWTIYTLAYDLVLGIFDILFTIFFREVKVRGSQYVPPNGTPTILVCAPHANQFIDPSLVMLKTRQLHKGRGRQTCFITAQKSLQTNKVVGLFGSCVGGIPVPRIQDNLISVDNNIEIYASDVENNPKLIRGRCKDGQSPEFTKRFTVKSLVGLPYYLGNAQISEIVDDETLLLSNPFKMENPKVKKLLTNGCNFKYAEKIDNSKTYQNVFDHLHTNGCVGIFPEGGSHDRPSLLPIKAGVVIMALGAVAADPSMKVHVVPCGLHYFHREKFRSRAVIEYGEPIIVDGELGRQYIESPRDTVSKLLDRVTDSLFSVTENAPDFDTLMAIQAARRLYQPTNHRFSLPLVVEINRRLLVGYNKYKDDSRIIALKKMVQRYNNSLFSMGLKDHQVQDLRNSFLGSVKSLIILITRVCRLLVLYGMSIPGFILFSPIFIISSRVSKKKAKQGLKTSLVKIKGTDIIATWKLIVALVLAPILYITYSIILIVLYARGNSYLLRVWVPFSNKFLQFIYFYSLLVFTTYSSLKTGEIGMDLWKSLPPLIISICSPNSKIREIKEMRAVLSREITDVCNDLGPTVFPDFEKFSTSNIMKSDTLEDSVMIKEINDTLKIYPNRSRSGSVGSHVSNALSRVNSRGSLTDIPIFSDGRINDSESVFSETSDTEWSEEATNITKNVTNGMSKIASLVREQWQEKEHDKAE
ncbi:similar to Saccharomyces cerevisiae YKR067W GPT2 Glycerol-3-phosphate/dihydroxyacetone phosphate dual substrate-specific sn-1 acyltransferase located in lipid particles and the ER [Maudiozyma barnettii]|uniref:Similar to Saccharomyces cerevisiae YKR067W GPT2 Glycerol-3-phosphate/dihydroxyacetone phosphate dual substrate-specific sn-1 acyltransferase located in lipid particles and the ER n=1 Tax=Maudiozyma barnettii TaxID=61262 RepID=A0A8H2ZIZ3_9SACH|nr:bifunctional glycerol-3-phosphate/glycerone-phosphate O-acyltransferase GPT2 [Kazachstania barnettii]CAB4256022.1 similar to Saccharomyces cerevisiae YKR067W GPT2 Glycerol-3-phosphate/dihydroxyacetone phosphate dual substrate-specific sn-1 acyltransferase located in lipid particles and the ER [Kazachstania barnettii]CAD1784630.1 similar to Saccharomyces cerevisiae YKR067W GPT2 Glycerol-3-phosphate/dihydroxyacetone phosphate dual substrate-specific sn-1 acyltransferase located in lipid particle